ncbi:MAG TPA: KamA family radical SAM protein [Fredinandcohnia sp.]|nr:KamA family radical SAM protein [Fredinandcohnia sp.]
MSSRVPLPIDGRPLLRRPPHRTPPRGAAIPSRRERFFPGVADADWNDWRWQARHTIRTLEALEARFPLTEEEREGVRRTASVFKLAITPYYLSLMDPEHFWCPVRRQAIPLPAEATVSPGELRDPLGEDIHRPVTSIVHKYPDRVLLLALDRCSVYCRHCTRRRITGQPETDIDRHALDEAVAWLRDHPEVRDVLISGGDPFLLSTPRLEELLAAVRQVPHVQIVRIGTRVPVCAPMRVDEELARTLRRYAPLFVVTHFNHPVEVTPEAGAACERLVDHGIPVENQTVLLRRLNSSARILTDLSHRLLERRVRPYYLHQMDVAEGIEHLRTSTRTGVEIVEQMRGWTSGLAIPHLAVDLPGGGGKVTLSPDYVIARGPRETRFRNYLGQEYAYPEPRETDASCPYEAVYYAEEG